MPSINVTYNDFEHCSSVIVQYFKEHYPTTITIENLIEFMDYCTLYTYSDRVNIIASLLSYLSYRISNPSDNFEAELDNVLDDYINFLGHVPTCMDFSCESGRIANEIISTIIVRKPIRPCSNHAEHSNTFYCLANSYVNDVGYFCYNCINYSTDLALLQVDRIMENGIQVSYYSIEHSENNAADVSDFEREEDDFEIENIDVARGNGEVHSYTANPIVVCGKDNSYKDISNNKSKYNPVLYLGVELEVEAKANINFNTAVGRTEDLLHNFAIMKHDGSLSDRGFEICSVPATLEYHKQKWDNFLDVAPKYLYSYKGGRCGLHVHMSADAISPLTLAKMLLFINADDHNIFLSDLSSREVNSRSSYCMTDNRKDKISKILSLYPENDNRYSALNIKTSKPTIEMRIFRGNLKKNSFFRSLEFCVALRNFCMDTSCTNTELSSLFKWIAKHRSEYPNLILWLYTKGYIKDLITLNSKSNLFELGKTLVSIEDGGDK
mgnify:CR=1 FL=1